MDGTKRTDPTANYPTKNEGKKQSYQWKPESSEKKAGANSCSQGQQGIKMKIAFNSYGQVISSAIVGFDKQKEK